MVGDTAPKTVNEAYEVQTSLQSILTASPIINVVGQKVGCTTAVMQEYLQIPHPCVGGIYDNALWRTTQWRAEKSIPHSIDRKQWHKIGLECELAVQLKTQLGPDAVTREEAASAVGSVHAALEIVDDRYEDFRAYKPTPLTWVADDFFHGGSVLGWPMKVDDAPLDPMLLDLLHGTMSVEGHVVGAGRGTDIIGGHPLEALRWLASSEAAPNGLPAGWVVSLGSVCSTHWLSANESRVHVCFQLGNSSVSFAEKHADSDNGGLVTGTADIDFR
eukprot:CAMPEP_0119311092 /NCGR_PEP_ID=MMETSP1333-20130426/21634_1 /TAXON_ID=418940 /ORGANISM="Scyphosphaera apsteinii, Strain RCC1455" /LENGTH=273 /DNA_ID=CAMNT_0007315395 /DNA_START=241 /DNA_END=1062 /DNA_ORIENTATION=-